VGPFAKIIQLDRVRCLDCGMKYAKPVAGGTVHENPGCPRCGYVGWIDTAVPASQGSLRHFAAGQRLTRIAQSR
jgi:hypothetical protein